VALNVLIGLGLIVLGTVLFFLWLPFARHRSHRAQRPPDAGPSTMELRDEPPAVVNLLVHELDLTGDAFAATLLDLATRRHVEIVELSPTENLVVPRRRDDALQPFEQCVLDVVDKAAAGGPHATVPAISAALDPGSGTIWFRFKAAVTADAKNRRLIDRARAAGGTKTIMVLALLPTVGMVVAVPELFFLTPFVWVGLLLVSIVLLVRGRSHVLTDEGRTAAAHWLGVRNFIADHGNFDDLPPGAVAVWDRYLAYGAAMDLSDDAVTGLIRELRTTMSFGDVHKAASTVHQLMRAQKDPDAARELRRQALQKEFGPEASPDAILGPSSPDFWTLVNTTVRAYPIAAMSTVSDVGAFRASALARVTELEAAAPEDVKTDVHVLAGVVRLAIDAVATRDDEALKALGSNPAVNSPEVRAAAKRFAAAALPHVPADSPFTEMLQAAATQLD
jgi:hypothetical protein